ncbi:hypothetical protein [Arcicella rigui]|uniref:Uncharacterized protein n=1 Tax=Arcicella rigui TaxID=797020 RepID=A0ABU5QAG3_9BACT|nr:hypothetical protein [Arcicella rigui]MEA5139831.1 hypothetical protein [Arcicella rigui]
MSKKTPIPQRSLESYYNEPTKEIATQYAYQLKNTCFDILDEIAETKENLKAFKSKDYQHSLGVIQGYLDTIRLINFSSDGYISGKYWMVLLNIAKSKRLVASLYFKRKSVKIYGLNEVQEYIECALGYIIDVIQELEQNDP